MVSTLLLPPQYAPGFQVSGFHPVTTSTIRPWISWKWFPPCYYLHNTPLDFVEVVSTLLLPPQYAPGFRGSGFHPVTTSTIRPWISSKWFPPCYYLHNTPLDFVEVVSTLLLPPQYAPGFRGSGFHPVTTSTIRPWISWKWFPPCYYLHNTPLDFVEVVFTLLLPPQYAPGFRGSGFHPVAEHLRPYRPVSTGSASSKELKWQH